MSQVPYFQDLAGREIRCTTRLSGGALAGGGHRLRGEPPHFPDVPTVVRAGWETIADGSLAAHVGASMLRVNVGTVLAILTAVPPGVAMGVSKGSFGLFLFKA